jgi:hypothetical protein
MAQMQIKGTEPTFHADVNEAAQNYQDAADELASKHTFFKRRRDELIAKMQRYGLKKYPAREKGLTVTLEMNAQLKVAKMKEDKPAKAPRSRKKGRRS